MTTDSATIIQRYFDQVWSAGDERAQAQLIAPNYSGYWLIAGMPVRQGPAGHLAWLNAIRAAMPDLRYTIEDMVVGDDAVAVRTTMSGTHRGDFFGLPPTGRSVRVNQINIEHFRDGRIVSHHRVTDMAELMRQLGVTG